MAFTPDRSPFSRNANRLYQEDDQQDSAPEDKEGGAFYETAAQRTPMQKAADTLYPEQAEPDEEGEESAEGADQQGDDSDDDSPDDAEKSAQGENGPAAQAGADRLHGVLGMFGVKGEPGSKEAEGAAKLEAGMRKAIADEEERMGRPLTSEEEQNISGEYIAGHAMKWLPLRKHDPDLMVKDMWDGVDNPDDIGYCARRFREAFGNSHGNAKAVGGKYPAAAKDWGPTLIKNGYEIVSAKNYVPQNGDVRVISGVTPKDPKNPGSAELNGHIEVYDAEHKQWVSERKEKGDGIAQMYKDRHATIAVYRFNPF